MDVRGRQAQVVTWICMLGNLLVALITGAVGWISGSKALLAYAADSASDVISSVVVLAGLRASQKEADKEHPYGHGKAEHVAAMVVAVLLGVVGIEIALDSVRVLKGGGLTAPSGIALAAILLALVAKEAMFQYKYRVGQRLKSQALIADAWNYRSDVLSSGAALIGVGGALIGDRFDLPWLLYLDPLAGITVSLFLLRVGYTIVQESINVVLETVLSEEESRRFADTILAVEGVLRIDELRVRTHGHYVIIDLKTGVNPDITVEAGHLVAKAVKHALLREHEDVRDVMVHINPVGR